MPGDETTPADVTAALNGGEGDATPTDPSPGNKQPPTGDDPATPPSSPDVKPGAGDVDDKGVSWQNRAMESERKSEAATKALEDSNRRIESLERRFAPKEEIDEERAEQIKLLKDLGKDAGFISKEDHEKELARERARTEDERLFNDLSKELDGSDGRPKFEKEKVEQFMLDNNVFDPKIAYNAMNQDALMQHAVEQALAGKKAPYAHKPSSGGPKAPAPKEVKKMTDAEFDASVVEELQNLQ